MIKFKLKELMENSNISRYRLQQITNWNYRRVNAFFFGKVQKVTLEEIEKLCEIFKCNISDLIEIDNK